ncbi:MAG: hypothetical protein IT288_11920 [Bdellovibrionales bacterium]|nr:hypothetical protein [Bdellovibrionales bacterium]
MKSNLKMCVLLICCAVTFMSCGRTDRKLPKNPAAPGGGPVGKLILQPSAELLGEQGKDGLEIRLPYGDQTQSHAYKGRWDGGKEPVAFSNPGNEADRISVFVMGKQSEVVIAVSYPNWDHADANSGTAFTFLRKKNEQGQYQSDYAMAWREKETSPAFVISLIESTMESEGLTAEQAVKSIAKSKQTADRK